MVVNRFLVGNGTIEKIENGRVYIRQGGALDTYSTKHYLLTPDLGKGGEDQVEAQTQQTGPTRNDASCLFRMSTWRQWGSGLRKRLDDQGWRIGTWRMFRR